MSDPSRSDAAAQSRVLGMRQIVALVITLVVLVIVFARVLPQLGDYDRAWDAIQAMSTPWVLALAVATLGVILVYVWPYQAALPGLGYGQGFLVRQTSFMISNAVPAGGAIGLAVQYQMLRGYGHRPEPVTAAIGVTATWNTLITLALPVLGLAGLMLTSNVDATAVAVAIAGLVIMGVMILVFVLVLRREDTARRVGDWFGRVLSRISRLIGMSVDPSVGQAVVGFRTSVVGVVSDRWVIITAANLVQQLSQFAVLWIALVAVQGGSSAATMIETFAAFAVARLATFIPIPPGGLGTTDAALTALLQGFGVSDDLALAAVLIWRAVTYFPQIFMGIATFLVWRLRPRDRTGVNLAG